MIDCINVRQKLTSSQLTHGTEQKRIMIETKTKKTEMLRRNGHEVR